MPWFIDDPLRGVIGPLTSDQLKQMAVGRELDVTTLVAKDGNGPWVPAANVKGLFPPPAPASKPNSVQGSPAAPSQIVQPHSGHTSTTRSNTLTDAQEVIDWFLSLAKPIALGLAFACMLTAGGVMLYRFLAPVSDASSGILGMWKSSSPEWKKMCDDFGYDEIISFVTLDGQGQVFFGSQPGGSFRFRAPRLMEIESADGVKSLFTVTSCRRSRLQLQIEGCTLNFSRVASADEAVMQIASPSRAIPAAADDRDKQGAINR